MLFQADSEQELLQSICEILVAGDELRLAWIGYCEDDAEKTIRRVAQAGYGLDYLERVKISWGEQTEAGQGPFGIAVRTGKAVGSMMFGRIRGFRPGGSLPSSAAMLRALQFR